MKPVTINVSEPVYRAFQQYAKRHDRTTAELIRAAMQAYYNGVMQSRQTIQGLPPLHLGEVLRPLRAGDRLEEMTNDPGH